MVNVSIHAHEKHRQRRRRSVGISTNDARQGTELKAIRYVLYASLTLAVLTLVLAYHFAV